MSKTRKGFCLLVKYDMEEIKRQNRLLTINGMSKRVEGPMDLKFR